MGGGTACPRERLNPLYRDSRIVVRGGIAARRKPGAVPEAFFADSDQPVLERQPAGSNTL
ncbi:MAG: hypothetical protein MZU95_01065 [Desulfomicrobium escambiense]|nr:hypothetical protein [Desulfomicrobium escambiense]